MSTEDLGLVAVTGAGGFVGRRLVRALRRAGADVRAFVRDVDRWRREATQADAGTEVLQLDLREPGDLAAHLRGVQHVCHVGAFRPPRLDDPAFAEECLRVNALATVKLLEAASHAGVAKLVYFSAGNAYARLDRPAREDDPLYPSSRATFYLGSKLCGELWVDHFARIGRLPGVSLRISSIYGPGMASTGMIPAFARALRTMGTVVVQDGGRFMADLVHVDDVVDAALSALGREVVGPINVGSGRASSALEVARTMATLLARDPACVDVAPATSLEPSGFAPLDIARARASLGYAPRGLEAGLASYLESLGWAPPRRVTRAPWSS